MALDKPLNFGGLSLLTCEREIASHEIFVRLVSVQGTESGFRSCDSQLQPPGSEVRGVEWDGLLRCRPLPQPTTINAWPPHKSTTWVRTRLHPLFSGLPIPLQGPLLPHRSSQSPSERRSCSLVHSKVVPFSFGHCSLRAPLSSANSSLHPWDLAHHQALIWGTNSRLVFRAPGICVFGL